MHQYWYAISKGNGQLYNNPISVPPLYSQPQIPKLGGINSQGIPVGWSGRVLPFGWKSPRGFKGFDRREQLVNWTSAGQMGLTAQESSSSWTAPADHKGFTSQKQLWNWLPPIDHDVWESQEQPANSPQLPNQLGFAPQGQPIPWAQPINHAGMFAQGQPLGWTPSAGHAGFKPKKQPIPWVQPINHAGMFAQGHPAGLLPPSANPFGFSASGQQAYWGGFGNPAGWGGQVNPMGWVGPGAPMGWNNQGNGQPGIFGGLLKAGKGTMNGIGIISSLIGVGKFLF